MAIEETRLRFITSAKKEIVGKGKEINYIINGEFGTTLLTSIKIDK